MHADIDSTTSSDSSSSSASDTGFDVGRTVGLVLLAASVVMFLIVIGLLYSWRTRPPMSMEGPVNPPDCALKPFNVVNAHDHLYKLEHLPKYLAAAKRTGVTRTLFVASSALTLTGAKGGKGRLTYENSETIIEAAKKYPGKIIPFCTIYPHDPDKLDKLKQLVADGAVGLKLYTGHQNFHDRPLDNEDMEPIYQYCDETGLPIVWHVNLQLYRKEFERVMARHPNMTVIMPHFGQAYWRPDPELQWMAELLDKYPNLYTDTSLGTRQILVDGQLRVGQYRDLFRTFCTKYSDRILFGTDMVVTGNSEKTSLWIESVIRACRDMLEKDFYYFPMGARGSKYGNANAHPYGLRRGLNLDDDTLRKIYETNPEKLFPAK